MAWSSGEVQRESAREVRRTELKRGLTEEGPPRRGRGIAPCITITYEAGAGAGQIAGRAAELLGYTLWDSALTTRLAHRMHVPERALREVETRGGGLLGWLRDLRDLRSNAPSGAGYRLALSGVVSELCGQGASVILGRGAALLVRPEQALRVRVVCPLELRVARHARRFGLDVSAARREVQATDRAEARFARHLVGHSGRDESAYDLVLSTGELAPEAASRLLVQAYTARFALDAPASRRAPEDAQLFA